jgi:YjbE family integral membrane protein
VESLIGHDGIETLIALGQVVFINVVLSADNAVVIGMAAMGLAAKDRLRVLYLGIALATLLRIGFAVVATKLLKVLGLPLAGGVLLLWVAWKLWRELRRTVTPDDAGVVAALETKTIGRALWQIVVADLSMSLDNVLAVAGVAIDQPAIMAVGLALSVLLMGVAAAAVARLLERHRWIAYVGLAIIVYVAAKMVWHGAQDIAAAATGHDSCWPGSGADCLVARDDRRVARHKSPRPGPVRTSRSRNRARASCRVYLISPSSLAISLPRNIGGFRSWHTTPVRQQATRRHRLPGCASRSRRS